MFNEKSISTAKYVALCQRALREHQATGELSMKAGADRLSQARPSRYAHPMLHAIYNIAWDVIEMEGLWTDAEKLENWQRALRLIEAYLAGTWAATTWQLSASYELRKAGQAVSGYSLTIARRNGSTTVLCANAEVKAVIEAMVATINEQQTDEWYVRNTEYMLPEQIGDLSLAGIEIRQYLCQL